MFVSPRQGNTIDADEVNQALAHTRLGGYVQHFPEVESTNDLALQAAQQGAKHGVWVADAQTAGRGRGGHTWHSTPGDGLYVSALFTPRLPAWSGAPASLSLTAGLAAWEAIRDVTGITADIRWPNDLVTRPVAVERSRKLGGVLVEAAFGQPEAHGERAMLRYAVIGIGINVAHRSFPPDISNLASSLYLEGWQLPDRQPLLIALLDKLDSFIRQQEESYAAADNDSGLFSQLERASTWLRGKRVHVPEEGGYTGVTAGLDSSGFLLVDSEDGVRRTVRSGGVREL
jgi:BirA family transcriptional regulator, biotin operon repressor / biotin---[acetyl-CoA-carboxylase] ligase